MTFNTATKLKTQDTDTNLGGASAKNPSPNKYTDNKNLDETSRSGSAGTNQSTGANGRKGVDNAFIGDNDLYASQSKGSKASGSNMTNENKKQPLGSSSQSNMQKEHTKL